MERDKLIGGLQKLEAVFSSVFWKGEKEHPEKTELLNTIHSAISLLQPQPIEDEKVREAVDILGKNLPRIQILSDFADKEYCGSALNTLLDLAQHYLSNNLAVGMSIDEIEKVITTLANNCYSEGAGKLDTTISEEIENAMKFFASRLPKPMSRGRLIGLLTDLELNNDMITLNLSIEEVADKIIAEGKE